MEQLHAHEVLHMMEGNSYSEASLKEAIVKTFGEDQRFYTCSAENMESNKNRSISMFLKNPILPEKQSRSRRNAAARKKQKWRKSPKR